MGCRRRLCASVLAIAVAALAAATHAHAQSTPSISGATPRCFLGEQFCVCGSFPSDASRNGLSVGGIPLGPPISGSGHVLWFAAPPVLSPGSHTITGDPAAGFAAGASAKIEMLGVEAWVDQDTLLVGQGTMLHVLVRGTTDALDLRLTNTTPETITLEGGLQVDLSTSGGASNEAPAGVVGIDPGPFAIDYALAEAQPCPCDPGVQPPTVWTPPDPGWTLSAGLRYELPDEPLVPESLVTGDTLPPIPAPPESLPTPPTPPDGLPPAPGDTLPPPPPPSDTIPGGGRPPDLTPPTTCSASRVEGRLTPSQGVWPDDPVFVDKPTKRIVKLAPNAYRNELKMVKDRKSLIFGIERPVSSMSGWLSWGGGPGGGRDEVYIEGFTNGSRLVPVSMRFTLKQSGREKVVYQTRIIGQVWLGEPCHPGAARHFRVEVPPQQVHRGLPPEYTEWSPFTFDATGGYLLEAELLAYGAHPTGIKVGVMGDVVETTAPSVALLPAILSPATAQERSSLLAMVQKIDAVGTPLMTEFLPLPPARPLSTILEIEDLSPHESWIPWGWVSAQWKDAAYVAELTRRLDAGARLSSFDRIVVFVRTVDFDQLVYTAEEAGAYATSQKVIFWHSGHTSARSLSHEIVHTLPYAFAYDQERAACGLGYHGTRDTKYAHGHAFADFVLGFENRTRHDGVNSLQDYGPGPEHRTNQCTFWHSLNQLQGGPPDPPVILVSGLVAREAGNAYGGLGPLYHVDGIVDLPDLEGVGEWAIVLRDASGDALGRFPFDPVWQPPDLTVERPVVGFSYRVPDSPEVAQVDLVGPGGKVLHTRTYSANAPGVRLVEPADGSVAAVRDGRVRVGWEATDADGDELVATVLYSPDGGTTWRTVAFDTRERVRDVAVTPDAKEHRVIVRVSDGARSAESAVSFSTRR